MEVLNSDHRQENGMKRLLVAMLILLTTLAFGLDKDVAKRALDREEAVAVKYQEQLVQNKDTLVDMDNDARFAQFRNRLTYLRQQIYVKQYAFNKPGATANERTTLQEDITTLTTQHSQILHDFQTFVNGLK
jgi:hypothetical protein